MYLYILDLNPLLDRLVQYFLPFCVFLFIFVKVGFEEQKVLFLVNSNLLIFFSIACTFFVLFKKIFAKPQTTKIFSHFLLYVC